MNWLSRFFYRLHLLFTDGPAKKTGLHPDYKKHIEYSFSIPDQDGNPIDYYSFTDAADMPTGRYSKWNECLEDYNRRFDNDELIEVVDELLTCLKSNNVEGITDAWRIAKYIKERTTIAMDVDLFLRFCSITYFTLDEDLVSYDWEVGTRKIDLFKSQGLHAFFLKQPIRKWLPQIKLSKEDLAIYQAKKKEILRIFKKRNLGAST